jgi:hypothetical protein
MTILRWKPCDESGSIPEADSVAISPADSLTVIREAEDDGLLHEAVRRELIHPWIGDHRRHAVATEDLRRGVLVGQPEDVRTVGDGRSSRDSFRHETA